MLGSSETCADIIVQEFHPLRGKSGPLGDMDVARPEEKGSLILDGARFGLVQIDCRFLIRVQTFKPATQVKTLLPIT